MPVIPVLGRRTRVPSSNRCAVAAGRLLRNGRRMLYRWPLIVRNMTAGAVRAQLPNGTRRLLVFFRGLDLLLLLRHAGGCEGIGLAKMFFGAFGQQLPNHGVGISCRQ